MNGPSDRDLPDGFQVQIDARCVRNGDLRYLVGGSPLRVLKMSEAALGMTSADGRIAVADGPTRGLARTLLESGIGLPRPMSGPTIADVTVVIPVYDNTSGLDALLPLLSGVKVIVVDDGSPEPVVVDRANVRVIRFEANRGPAAARNAGVAAASTGFVAFMDSDTRPVGDWLLMLLAHFSDPTVAIVAPRIVGHPSGRRLSPVARYANGSSSLDMGPREAPVAPMTRLPYVPSAAMLVRKSAFAGFDESMRVAEDVDLCLRTHQAGWRIYYDPIAKVAHSHRENLSSLLNRRRFYGTGAAPLARRHDGQVAPVMSTAPMALAVIALLTRTRIGLLLAAIVILRSGVAVRRRLGDVPAANLLAAQCMGRAVGNGLLQAASAVLRHYWPVTVLAALIYPPLRRRIVELAIAEGMVMWVQSQVIDGGAPTIGPVAYTVMRRLDDLAYGAGLWQGVLAELDVAALRPVLVA
ncbi:MAG: mycofactocin biosynthesis glycosyltransferase MftF [Gordonia sp. (in: high G+C Gram-positive bacteria)]